MCDLVARALVVNCNSIHIVEYLTYFCSVISETVDCNVLIASGACDVIMGVLNVHHPNPRITDHSFTFILNIAISHEGRMKFLSIGGMDTISKILKIYDKVVTRFI